MKNQYDLVVLAIKTLHRTNLDVSTAYSWIRFDHGFEPNDVGHALKLASAAIARGDDRRDFRACCEAIHKEAFQ